MSGAAQFRNRAYDAIVRARAAEQPNHLCRGSLGPHPFHGGQDITSSRAPMRSPPIRNACNPSLLVRESQ
eukprot:2467543-Alexandrium_andersonii.AAC.1